MNSKVEPSSVRILAINTKKVEQQPSRRDLSPVPYLRQLFEKCYRIARKRCHDRYRSWSKGSIY